MRLQPQPQPQPQSSAEKFLAHEWITALGVVEFNNTHGHSLVAFWPPQALRSDFQALLSKLAFPGGHHTASPSVAALKVASPYQGSSSFDRDYSSDTDACNSSSGNEVSFALAFNEALARDEVASPSTLLPYINTSPTSPSTSPTKSTSRVTESAFTTAPSSATELFAFCHFKVFAKSFEQARSWSQRSVVIVTPLLSFQVFTKLARHINLMLEKQVSSLAELDGLAELGDLAAFAPLSELGLDDAEGGIESSRASRILQEVFTAFTLRLPSPCSQPSAFLLLKTPSVKAINLLYLNASGSKSPRHQSRQQQKQRQRLGQGQIEKAVASGEQPLNDPDPQLELESGDELDTGHEADTGHGAVGCFQDESCEGRKEGLAVVARDNDEAYFSAEESDSQEPVLICKLVASDEMEVSTSSSHGSGNSGSLISGGERKSSVENKSESVSWQDECIIEVLPVNGLSRRSNKTDENRRADLTRTQTSAESVVGSVSSLETGSKSSASRHEMINRLRPRSRSRSRSRSHRDRDLELLRYKSLRYIRNECSFLARNRRLYCDSRFVSACLDLNIAKNLWDLRPCVLAIWEAVIAGNSILVLGTSASHVSQLVLSLRHLLVPLSFQPGTNVCKPLTDTYDPDFHRMDEILRSSNALVGTTNPICLAGLGSLLQAGSPHDSAVTAPPFCLGERGSEHAPEARSKGEEKEEGKASPSQKTRTVQQTVHQQQTVIALCVPSGSSAYQPPVSGRTRAYNVRPSPPGRSWHQRRPGGPLVDLGCQEGLGPNASLAPAFFSKKPAYALYKTKPPESKRPEEKRFEPKVYARKAKSRASTSLLAGGGSGRNSEKIGSFGGRIISTLGQHVASGMGYNGPLGSQWSMAGGSRRAEEGGRSQAPLSQAADSHSYILTTNRSCFSVNDHNTFYQSINICRHANTAAASTATAATVAPSPFCDCLNESLRLKLLDVTQDFLKIFQRILIPDLRPLQLNPFQQLSPLSSSMGFLGPFTTSSAANMKGCPGSSGQRVSQALRTKLLARIDTDLRAFQTNSLYFSNSKPSRLLKLFDSFISTEKFAAWFNTELRMADAKIKRNQLHLCLNISDKKLANLATFELAQAQSWFQYVWHRTTFLFTYSSPNRFLHNPKS